LLAIAGSEFPTLPSSLEVSFADGFGRPRLSVPLQFNAEHQDAHIEPETCIIMVPQDTVPSSLKSLSLREFHVQSRELSQVEVQDIVGATDELVWKIGDTDGSKEGFTLWLKSLPQSPVSRLRLTVNYTVDQGKEKKTGQLSLDIHVFQK